MAEMKRTEALPALQKFLVAWMDELWWSMRDRVGALSIIECLQNSWRAGGREIGETAKRQGLSAPAAMEAVLAMLGREAQVQGNTVRVLACPLWNRIKERGLEYAFHCEEFATAPLLTGLKDALGLSEVKVETSLRLAHLDRAKLEYKLSQLKGTVSDASTKKQRAELEEQLKRLPKQPACIFHIR
jgi:hypothetical protein